MPSPPLSLCMSPPYVSGQLDSGLNLFLDSSHRAAREIVSLAEALSSYREQAALLASRALDLANALRDWVYHPPPNSGHDDYTEAVELDRELKNLKTTLTQVHAVQPRLSQWESHSSLLTASWLLLSKRRYYVDSYHDETAYDRAKHDDHAAFLSLSTSPKSPVRSPVRQNTYSNGLDDDNPTSPRTASLQDSIPLSRWSSGSSERHTSRSPTIASSTTKKSPAAQRVNLLLKRMNDTSMIDARWAGVGSMEQLRALTPSQTVFQAAVDKLVNTEKEFIASIEPSTLKSRYFPNPAATSSSSSSSSSMSSRASHATPKANISDIIDRTMEMYPPLASAHRVFLHDLLETRRNSKLISAAGLALILIKHATEFVEVHTRLARDLPTSFTVLETEARNWPDFKQWLETTPPSDPSKTIKDVLRDTLLRPLLRVEFYPTLLRAILREMNLAADEAAILKDASNALVAIGLEARLLAWQTSLGQHPVFDLTWNDLSSKAEWLDYSHAVAPRQTAIFDYIKEEMRYVRKLEEFNEIYLEGLDAPRMFAIANPETYDNFCDFLVGCIKKLLNMHTQLLKRLHNTQYSELPIISALCEASGLDQIKWSRLYQIYFKRLSETISYLNELEHSPTFQDFIKSIVSGVANPPESLLYYVKQPLEHFARSIPLLRDIMDSSPPDHPDAYALSAVIMTFTELKELSNPKRSSLTHSLEHYATYVRFPEGFGNPDVALSALDRKLLHDGHGFLISEEGDEARAPTKVLLILLDNYILVTEPITVNGIERYELIKRPIPLELVDTALITQEPPHKALHMMRGITGDLLIAAPLTLGRRDHTEDSTFLVPSQEDLQKWRRKIHDAVRSRLNREKIYELALLCESVRGASHAAPFAFDGVQYIVYSFLGERGGVWLVPVDNLHSQPHMCLQTKDVDQLAVIGYVVLVLTKGCILAYNAHSLIAQTDASKPPKFWEVDNSHQVLFFRIHRTQNQASLVVAASVQGARQVRVYDGLSLKLKSTLRNQKVHIKELRDLQCNFMEKLQDVVFGSIGVTTLGFRFLTDKPKKPAPQNTSHPRDDELLPRPNDPQSKLVGKCRASQALSMHPIGKQNLLCYQEFGVYTSSDNGKLTGRCIEWECRPANAIIWRPPHFFLISRRCIEVRDMTTGSLVQLLVGPWGQKVVCDGRGISDDVQSTVLISSINHDGRYNLWALTGSAPHNDPR